MKILITGANGYVGARLTCSLLKNGVKVRMATRSPLKPHPAFEGAENISLDMEHSHDSILDQAFIGVDRVIHLAAMNEQQCRLDPEKALRVNAWGTHRLVQAALRAKTPSFLYLSTAHVYGSPLKGDYSEESPTRPLSHYAITHRAAEDYVLSSAIPGKSVLRLTNGIGAPILPETNCWMLLVNDLCKQVVSTGKLGLQSAGLARRDFVSLTQLDELVRKDILPQIHNVASSHTISVMEMAKLIQARHKALHGQDAEITTPPSKNEPISAPPDFKIRSSHQASINDVQSLYAAIDETLLFCQKYFASVAKD